MKQNVLVQKNLTELVIDTKHYERMFYSIQRNILLAVCMLLDERLLPNEESPLGPRFIRTYFGKYIVDVQKFNINKRDDEYETESFNYETDIQFKETHERVGIFVRNAEFPNGIPHKMMYCTEWSLTTPWLSKYMDQVSFDEEDEYTCDNAFETKHIYLLADILDELHLFCKANEIDEYMYCRCNGYSFINLKNDMIEFAHLYSQYLKIVDIVGKLKFEVEYDIHQDLMSNLGRAIEDKEEPFAHVVSIPQGDDDADMEIPF